MEIQIPQSVFQIHHQEQEDHNQQETSQITTKQKPKIPRMVHIHIPKSDIFHSIHNQWRKNCKG